LGIARDFAALDAMPWELGREEAWQQCTETTRSKASSLMTATEEVVRESLQGYMLVSW